MCLCVLSRMPRGNREKDRQRFVRKCLAAKPEACSTKCAPRPLVRAIFRPCWRGTSLPLPNVYLAARELFPSSESRLLPIFPWVASVSTLAAVCVARLCIALRLPHTLAPDRRRSVAARATGSARLGCACVGDDDNRPNRWCWCTSERAFQHWLPL